MIQERLFFPANAWLSIRSGGEGESARIAGAWPWPLWLTIILFLVMAYLIFQAYRLGRHRLSLPQRVILMVLRAAACLVIVFMLGGWVLVLEKTAKPLLAVIVDDSQSMNLAQGAAAESAVKGQPIPPVTRWEVALDTLACGNSSLLGELEGDCRLMVFSLDPEQDLSMTPQTLKAALENWQPRRSTTPLGRAIDGTLKVLRGQDPVGIVILSDGVVNEGPGLQEAAKHAAAELVPLYFVGFGPDRVPPDLALQNWIMEEQVFLEDKVALQAEVVAKNTVQKEVLVRLRDVTNNRLLGEEKVPLSPQGLGTLRLTFQADRGGDITLRLECQSLPGEINTANNALVKRISVRQEKIRVLLIEDLPRFEYRFVRNLLLRDPGVALTSVLLGADPEAVPEIKGAVLSVPDSFQELSAYDVIIMGDLPARELLRHEKNLVDFVTVKRPPGGLLVLAGPEFPAAVAAASDWRSILPCQIGANFGAYAAADDRSTGKLSLTPDGLAMPWMALDRTPQATAKLWRDLPPIYWWIRGLEVKPGARVLAGIGRSGSAEEITDPVIMFHFVGLGRVLFHGTDELWRWRRLDGWEPYAQYWRRVIRFMARGKLEAAQVMRLATDKTEYAMGEAVRMTLELAQADSSIVRGDQISVWVERQGGPRRELVLKRHPTRSHLFEAQVLDLPPGVYYAWLPDGSSGTVGTNFTVSVPLRESESLVMNRKDMEAAARLSGGKFFLPSDISQLQRHLPRRTELTIESLPPVSLWNSPLVLGALLAILALEWALRKRWGLL